VYRNRSAGVLVIRKGKYGSFFGCSRYPTCTFTAKIETNLENIATQLLKEKRPRTRRGKGGKKKAAKQAQHQKDMELYRKQKKERGQMFKDFKRLIDE
jgi:ssDNA-binding Zn-finger/Zn-ribbon topoisomerase 1